MNLEHGSTHIYGCPICGVDTSHTVSGERSETYAIVCSNCHNGSLVSGDDLRFYQKRWEEELREILDSLENPE